MIDLLCREHLYGADETSTDPVDTIERTLRHVSWVSQRQLMHLLDEARFQMTLPQFHTLAYLQRIAGECTMTDLARATHQSAASLSGVVDRLCEKNLVERVRDNGDRRRIVVILTTQGTLLMSEIEAARRSQMQAALADVSDEELVQVMQTLDRVLERMMRFKGESLMEAQTEILRNGASIDESASSL